MGMSCEEFDKQKADLSKRFYIDNREDDNFGYRLIDRSTGKVVGYDGGEPEDQLLVRDWEWVPETMNNLVSEFTAKAERMQAVVDAAMDALPNNDEIESYSAFATEIQTDEPEAASLIRAMCIKLRQARAAVEKEIKP